VVDEAIYAIKPDSTQDIVNFFFGRGDGNSVFTSSSLEYYFSGEAGKRRMRLAQLRPASHLAQLKPDRLVKPKVRKLFPDIGALRAHVLSIPQFSESANLVARAAASSEPVNPLPMLVEVWHRLYAGAGNNWSGAARPSFASFRSAQARLRGERSRPVASTRSSADAPCSAPVCSRASGVVVSSEGEGASECWIGMMSPCSTGPPTTMHSPRSARTPHGVPSLEP
jgi:hypothetical protein